MRKIITSEYVTVDGVMQAPGDPKEFEYGGWVFKLNDEQVVKEGGKYASEQLFSCDALLLGRVTYEGFAKAWPNMKDDSGFANKMNSMKKYVVSNTLDKLEWSDSTLIKGDIVEEILKLKQQPGKDILIYGSGELVNTLMHNNLIDEHRLWVYPVVLGSGKHLFREGIDITTLKLVDTKKFGGVILLCYQPAK